ncbi:MAG: prolyl oligopeptidase family serine peptidase [Bacteroidota bacterium]
MKNFVIIFSLSLLLFACDQAPKNVIPELNQFGSICDLSYGPEDRHSLDISLPANRTASTPVIMLIHGGAWVGGDKGDMTLIRESLMRKSGMAVASMNYRFVGPADIGYEELMADIDLALDYIDSKASDWTIGTGNFGIAGGSAGGHLSLLYAYAYDTDQRIKAVSSLAGPTDLTDSLFIEYASNYNLDYVLSELIDADYPQNEALLEAASPISQIRNLPTQLQHGEDDDLVPLQQAQALADALEAQGYPKELISYPDVGHDISGLLGTNINKVVNHLSDWFKTYL